MRKIFIAIGLFIVAIAIVSALDHEKGSTKKISSKVKTKDEMSIIDDPNVKLGEHQIALKDLYIEIPFRKEQVLINRRMEDGTIILDVKDKETNKLLFSCGEKTEGNMDKTIFREITSGKTKLRIQAVIELDPKKHAIQKVMKTEIVAKPVTSKVENKFITAGSRSGGFPAEKVEVLANLTLIKKNLERMDFYEGFLFGVVNKTH